MKNFNGDLSVQKPILFDKKSKNVDTEKSKNVDTEKSKNVDTEIKRITLGVPLNLYKKLKIELLADENIGKNQQVFINEMIEFYLKNKK